MRNRDYYKKIADLFRYPDKMYKENVEECVQILHALYPKSFTELEPFYAFIRSKNLFEIEEVFGKTFHIQAICYLDLGYVLFAEDYKRGDFLVKIKNEQRKVNNDCGNELADNLTNILTLMALIEDEAFLEEFAVRIVIPALEKMLGEFDASRMALKDKVRKKKQKVILLEDMEHKNIYQHAIQSLLYVIEKDFPNNKYDDVKIEPTIGGNFLRNCEPTSGCSTVSKIVKTN